MSEYRIYLASNSPRRRELLDQIGVTHRVLRVAVDETALPGEGAAELVRRLALAKARAGRDSLSPGDGKPVLAADTVVVAGDCILGKPRDRAEALAMLSMLSGGEHEVLSAVALVDGRREQSDLSRSTVRLRRLTAGEAETYWATGEPADKAGAYAVQGLAAIFIEELVGSYSGVMGLPLFETARLLNEFGIDVLRSG